MLHVPRQVRAGDVMVVKKFNHLVLHSNLALQQRAHYFSALKHLSEHTSMSYPSQDMRESHICLQRQKINCTFFLQAARCICKEAACKGCQNPVPCFMRQIQASPNHP